MLRPARAARRSKISANRDHPKSLPSNFIADEFAGELSDEHGDETSGQAAHQNRNEDQAGAAAALQGHPAERRLHAARIRRAGAEGCLPHGRGDRRTG